MNMHSSVVTRKIRSRQRVVLIMSLMLGVFMISPVLSREPVVNPKPTPGIVTVIGPSSVINEATIMGKCKRVKVDEDIKWGDDDIEGIGVNKKTGDEISKYILETVDVEAMVCNVPDINNLTADFGKFGKFDKQGADVNSSIKKSKKLNLIIKYYPLMWNLECGCTVTVGSCTCCCGKDNVCECRL